MGDLDRAISYNDRALAAARESRFRWAEAYALGHLAESLRRAARPAQAIPRYRASLAIYQEFGDRFGQALQLWGLGAALRTPGYQAQARAILRHIGGDPVRLIAANL